MPKTDPTPEPGPLPTPAEAFSAYSQWEDGPEHLPARDHMMRAGVLWERARHEAEVAALRAHEVAVAHAVGICHEPEGHAVQPGPRALALGEVERAVKTAREVAALRSEVEAWRDWAGHRVGGGDKGGEHQRLAINAAFERLDSDKHDYRSKLAIASNKLAAAEQERDASRSEVEGLRESQAAWRTWVSDHVTACVSDEQARAAIDNVLREGWAAERAERMLSDAIAQRDKAQQRVRDMGADIAEMRHVLKTNDALLAQAQADRATERAAREMAEQAIYKARQEMESLQRRLELEMAHHANARRDHERAMRRADTAEKDRALATRRAASIEAAHEETRRERDGAQADAAGAYAHLKAWRDWATPLVSVANSIFDEDARREIAERLATVERLTEALSWAERQFDGIAEGLGGCAKMWATGRAIVNDAKAGAEEMRRALAVAPNEPEPPPGRVRVPPTYSPEVLAALAHVDAVGMESLEPEGYGEPQPNSCKCASILDPHRPLRGPQDHDADCPGRWAAGEPPAAEPPDEPREPWKRLRDVVEDVLPVCITVPEAQSLHQRVAAELAQPCPECAEKDEACERRVDKWRRWADVVLESEKSNRWKAERERDDALAKLSRIVGYEEHERVKADLTATREALADERQKVADMEQDARCVPELLASAGVSRAIITGIHELIDQRDEAREALAKAEERARRLDQGLRLAVKAVEFACQQGVFAASHVATIAAFLADTPKATEPE